MTYSRVLQPADVLLFIKMGAKETLRSYTRRYKELYNEIGGGNEKIATSTFHLGLPEVRIVRFVEKEASRGYEAVDEVYQRV